MIVVRDPMNWDAARVTLDRVTFYPVEDSTTQMNLYKAGEVDAAKRRALLEHAEAVMLKDHPLLPIYFYVNKHLVKPEVSGWYDNIMNVVYTKDLGLGH